MVTTVSDAAQLALHVERWIAEARGGNRAALERLLEACSPYLLLIANRELGGALRSRLDPVDVVQDTLVKAWRHFPQFRGQTELAWLSWLWQILRRNLANERRSHIQTAMRSIQREVHLTEDAPRPRSHDAGRASAAPDRQAQTQELHEILEGALRRLPGRYREAFRLHTREELTFAQVGERLHCSAEAARKLWRRAAAKLSRLLRDALNSD
jgi:RNA polymerase sigma-70 factor (ECF subfamily)